MYHLLDSANADMIATTDCKHVLCPHCGYCIECKSIIKRWYVINPKGEEE